MSEGSAFLMVTCQAGAEGALKGEMARTWPDFRLAYSRPGFVTFKLPTAFSFLADFDFGAVFARATSFSLGKIVGTDPAEMARRVWELWGGRTVERIHVWQRDQAAPGDPDAIAGVAPEARAVAARLVESCPQAAHLRPNAAASDRPARRGDAVLDCVLVEPGQWWIGHHVAGSLVSRWPGGMFDIALPADVVSRAHFKMEEALRWSELPIPAKARCMEIGSAPGGASQALLARQLEVIGVDPAAMAPAVASHPRFTHIRRRVVQVPKRAFRKVRWLTADMNVAPAYTLEAVESIVTHSEVNVRGLLLTLKLVDWKLADELPAYLERVRSWGYNIVRARQLVGNRQEVCVAALQKPFVRKPIARRR
jgi:23S rRNA (cytidine2498-2'-O)-methyltransferase